MATNSDTTKPAADAPALPNPVAAVVETAPVAAAAVMESVAKALPTATRKVKRAVQAAPKGVRAPKGRTAAKRAKPITTTIAAAKAAVTLKGKPMTDTVKTITQKGEQLFADMKSRVEGSTAKGQQLIGELNDFNKGNVEALVESGKIAAKGFEKLGQDAADYTRRSFEQTTSAFKSMASVKSPTELMKLQSDYVRSSFDMLVAETSRSTEAMLKLAGEIAQPISNRFAVAADKVKLAA